MKGMSLEVKVGLLILAAAAMLGTLLFLLGGVSFEDTYTVYVDFNNPGSVQPGAAVRVGGVKVGTIEEVTYLGRRLDPRTERRALVRYRLSIHESVRETIHADAIFYVTSQGVLGEQFIAVEPGDPDLPALAPDAVCSVGPPPRGHCSSVDQPRLDLALNLGYELLETIVNGIRDNRESLGNLVDDIVALIHGLRMLLSDNRGDLDAIVDNVRTLSDEGVTTLRAAREAYVDGERPRRILSNLDRTVAQAPALMSDVRSAAEGADQLVGSFGPDQRRQIQSTLASAERIATQAETTMTEANEIVHHVREGQGTVGALLMDEEVYDDLQELVRDLKHNPWRFFWRE
ncbi:MAG: MCE family protein [Sandaracinaceae bacterium]|nr:MCE family protein [Sandaracinaceae bacterium]